MKRIWSMLGIILLMIGTYTHPFTGDVIPLNVVKNDIRTLYYEFGSPPKEEWNNTYPLPSMVYTSRNCVQESPDDGYIVTGYAGYGYWYNLYLLKVDHQGKELWNRTFGGSGNNSRYNNGFWVEVTQDNGYIITGKIGFDNIDVWLIKTDLNGNKEWNRTFGGSGDDSGHCVKQTGDGGYIITGDTSTHIWLIKTDAFGNELWNSTYDSRPGYGASLALTSDGGYVVTGSLVDSRLILLKTDANGSLEWDSIFGLATHSNSGESVQQTFDGGYIVGGSTTSYGAGFDDFWLIKTDGQGVEEWNRTFGGSHNDFGRSVIQTSDGGYLIGGEKNWPAQFWLVRTNPYGDIIWDSVYVPLEKASCLCVRQTKDQGYIASGEINPYDAPECVLVKIKPDVGNQPPSPPLVESPNWGITNNDVRFYMNSTDPDADSIYYQWNWGDGNITAWLGPYPSGIPSFVSHAWSERGTYEIQVRNKDDFGHENNWSEPVLFCVYELKNAILFGRYTNLTAEENYSTAEAVNLRLILFQPFHQHHYFNGEPIRFLRSESRAFITPRFIIGMVAAVI